MTEIKTLQWNIGGAKVMPDGADPLRASSYSEDGLEAVIEILCEQDADVITLQEVHESRELDQAKEIARALEYDCVSSMWSPSHLEVGCWLGQAVLSKYLITESWTQGIVNPYWQARFENGCVSTSHDKGITSCTVDIDGAALTAQSVHLIPFAAFDKDPLEDGREILKDVGTKIGDHPGPHVVGGDFNIDSESLQRYFENLLKGGLAEVKQKEATTPKGRKLDHILYSGMTLVKSLVIKENIRTDHYPVVAIFSF